MDKCYLFFETLGSKLKIDIILKLRESSFNVNELSNKLNQERSKVSHALKLLLECGFIKVKNKGRERVYSLNEETILPLLSIVEKHVNRYCKVCKRR
ncbi:helix-turn-helix transcriptional regulator [Candidatus Woesearchaeota archaeon]|nr:helix-turn-helix transcriptional regulator [Candidatus Woesearchaeota archaeon]